MIPLYDAYAAPARANAKNDPRLSPILAPLEGIPPDVLMIIPEIDVLLHEQQSYVNRVKGEIGSAREYKGTVDGKRKIEALFFDKAFHGWLECESCLSILKLCCCVKLTWNTLGSTIHHCWG